MSKRGLFVGLTTVDIQFFIDEQLVPNTKIKSEMPFMAAGGPAANAAIAFSFLGGEAHFLTCIGQHNFSETIKTDFSKHSINVIDALDGLPNEPIVAAIVTTTFNSDRTVFTHHPERNSTIKAGHIHRLLEFDFVFIDGFYPELAVEICAEANKMKIPVIFDGGSWKAHLPELLPFVEVAICSDNFWPPGCADYNAVFEFLKMFNCSQIAITRGADSIVTPLAQIPVDKVEAIDSLGAGDILHGAFCYFWEKNNNFEDALKKAAHVASFSTKFKGTREWMQYGPIIPLNQ